jgi:pilus assembly protein CpaE
MNNHDATANEPHGMTMASSLQSASAAGHQDLVAFVPRISIQVYAETQQTADMIQLAAADRRMQRADMSVHLGGIMGAFHAFQARVTQNLLVVESRGTREAILSDLAMLAEVCHADTKVVVIGHINDVLLYRDLSNRGVSEYLVAPLQQLQFIEAIAALYRDPKAAPIGRAIAFIGAKGGVGSSSLAQNVAWAIARHNSTETVIADLDLAFGTVGLNLNQDIPPGIADILTQPDRVDPTLIERMLVKAGDRLSILGGPGGVERDYQIEPPAIDSVLAALRSSVPCTVLDLPALWAPWIKHALMHADQVVIIATPELASLRNARSLFDVVRAGRPNDGPPLLILNQAGVPKRLEISVADFSKGVGVPVSRIVPYDAQSFGVAQGNGQMILEVARKSKAASAILDLAQQLAKTEKPAGKTALASSLLNKIALLRKK